MRVFLQTTGAHESGTLTFLLSPLPKGKGDKSPIVTKYHSFTTSIARLSSAN
jgi:hypothetical protein